MVGRYTYISVLFCAFALTAASCGKDNQPSPPTAFMGHVIGEDSRTWTSKEPGSKIDPLLRCQEIVRSPDLRKYLDSEGKCQDFVHQGNYLITLQDTSGGNRVRVYQFVNWMLALIAIQFPEKERGQVIVNLNSQFATVVPNKVWHGKDGAYIDIRPTEQLNELAELKNPEGFLVVVTRLK